MAGIAPLGGAPTTNAPEGTAATVPGTITPPQQDQPPAKPPEGPNFTAFPSSYAGFGSDGNGFGTLSVVNGALSIVSAPAQPPAQPPAAPKPPAPPPGSDQAANVPGSTPQATGAPDNTPKPAPPPPPPPPPPPVYANANANPNPAPAPNPAPNPNPAADLPGQPPSPYTAITAQDVPNLERTDTTQGKAANEAATLDKTAATPQPGGPGSDTANGPGQTPGTNSPTPGNQPPPAPVGLLGASGPPPIPGGTAVENNPALGLLGAPATNPIYIQYQTHAQNAAEEAAAAAAAAAAQEAAARQQLEQVNFRIAAARADNNAAAAAQLAPAAAKLTGQIQNQTFVGLGTTPPQSFAPPAIPPVFLNVAS